MPIWNSGPARAAATGNKPGTHPLEVLIPYFRRYRPSVPRDIVYTLIWNTLLTIVFTAFGLLFETRAPVWIVFRNTFVFAQCIGFIIYLSFIVGDRIFGPGIHCASLPARATYYTLLPIGGVFLGYLLAFRLLNWDAAYDWFLTPRGLISVFLISAIITGILMMIFIPRERAARAEAAIAREQARVAAAEKEATTARMKLLEAQVEPHFLYNTLAHVVSLVDGEPAVAKRMIESLIALLRATATAATGASTLASQTDLLRDYLEILALRMGARLDWRIDVPAELAALRVPPMLLQPVVENAIKHGLEPTVEGGKLEITARRTGGCLLLAVTDTGRGIRATAPRGAAGLGLPNLRARLAALFGDEAQVAVEDNPPRGTRVTITLPVEDIDAEPVGSSLAGAGAR